MKYPIVRPFLPKNSTYHQFIDEIFERNWLTNNGPCLQELEAKLKAELDVEHLMLVSNGTLALHVAYAALGISGTVLTTPFSFAATASSLLFQGITPEFIDIDLHSYNLDIEKASDEQLDRASAIVAVHVFGNPCDHQRLQAKAQKHNLKIVYDAAHAFGAKLDGKALLSYGDAATVSLHATKMFHTVEGGAIIFKHKADLEKAKKLINFGFNEKQIPDCIGTNAKLSEVHAAMGLAVYEHLPTILEKRARLHGCYTEALGQHLQLQVWHEQSSPNGAYFPVIFKSEDELLFVSAKLTEQGIQSRRYFYPSLSEIPEYGMQGFTPIANEISRKVLCLPMYFDLTPEGITEISQVVIDALTSYRSGM